jgi:hypothetical protein
MSQGLKVLARASTSVVKTRIEGNSRGRRLVRSILVFNRRSPLYDLSLI